MSNKGNCISPTGLFLVLCRSFQFSFFNGNGSTLWQTLHAVAGASGSLIGLSTLTWCGQKGAVVCACDRCTGWNFSCYWFSVKSCVCVCRWCQTANPISQLPSHGHCWILVVGLRMAHWTGRFIAGSSTAETQPWSGPTFFSQA